MAWLNIKITNYWPNKSWRYNKSNYKEEISSLLVFKWEVSATILPIKKEKKFSVQNVTNSDSREAFDVLKK